MVKNLVVIGSGVMGQGIAYVSAIGGFYTTVVDIDSFQLERAEREIEGLFQKGIERGKVAKKDREEATSRLLFTTDLKAAVKEADFIIEAVPEKREIKKQVLQQVDHYAPAHAVIASNTSTISPTELGSYTQRPEQLMAMHFFNPVHKMSLVEMIKGLETSEQTVEVVQMVAQKMRKETVVINEFPGFVTSRISALVGNEAFYMLQEGIGSPEEIDRAIKLGLNYPMGPFELGDLVGLDTRLNNLRYLHEKLGEKYRPAPLLEQYVQAGRLGRKSGRGVYDYKEKVNSHD
ncbi:3-hydroxybutyryl-CoA dehydrogenase [Bacillus coahuilensis m2-6]|uniref:3-hydroxyacyl-CoA dehydrogenase n=1 Tax=Bacillus coahuilensis TaxID=408580 RepID=UPI0007501354|nr:3-hydroxyacyl-CoA dehydrogenase [Bacillus coahuilensis]KUP09300.1 3-hydroxybutyryl-CoA dehydrogenase [Bacillus coahuilensis m2-6]